MAGRPELSRAKRNQILEGAAAVFREAGYERTSVDAIAARAGVSKATIYNHFHDKEALFVATVEQENQGVRERFLSLLEHPTGDIEADLRKIGEQLLRLTGSPASVMRFRIIVAEAGRFPQVCQSLYDCGIVAGHTRMSAFLARATQLGLLAADDLDEAAIAFTSLCVDNALRLLHLGIVTELTEELIEREVTRAVRTFLRAYRAA